MKEVTLDSFSAFTIPFAGIHEETGLVVRSDGYVLAKSGYWTQGTDQQTKGSHLVYKRYTYQSKPQKRRMTHVLVAETFLRNPEHKPTVDHIDRNSLNNDVFNLRFASYTEQARNTKRHLNKPDESTRKTRQKERSRQYYIEHSDQIKKRSHEWYLAHRRKKLASMTPVIRTPEQEADDTHNDKKK